MDTLFLWIARLSGIVGIALSFGAVLTRLRGSYWLGDFQAGTLLQAGTAAMVLACLAYVAVLAERRGD
ncbi:MAG: hypothetical protein WCA12_16310 [Burkholderiales bacterium]